MTSTNGISRVRPLADAVGLTGSVLCALHCLIVPISLVVGPLGQVPSVEDEVFHRVLLWVVVPAAILAFAIGCLHHRDRWVLLLGGVGLVCLAAAFTFLHDVLGESGEQAAAILASGLLVGAHVRNFRLCRADACDHASPAVDDC